MVGVAIRKNALLRSAGFLVAACTPENAIVASRIQCLAQGQRLHDLRVNSAAVLDRVDALLKPFRIGVDDEAESLYLQCGQDRLYALGHGRQRGVDSKLRLKRRLVGM